MRSIWDRLGELPSRLPPPDGRRRAAVLVPLFEDERGRVRMVLIKRPDEMPTHAGDLAFPGGMVSDRDEDLRETALREAWEEVRIDPEEVEVLGVLEAVRTASEWLLVVPVVARLGTPPSLDPDPREVAGVLTPELEEFFDQARWRSEHWAGREIWFFELEEEVLWGATARMVRQLLAFLGDGLRGPSGLR